VNHIKDEGFYGVNCIKCGKPICLNQWQGIVPDAQLPISTCENPYTRCPYCNDRCIYAQDRLVYYQRLVRHPSFSEPSEGVS
jgi:DNA-directed RNA polymerase subunit RPC12/RpoP